MNQGENTELLLGALASIRSSDEARRGQRKARVWIRITLLFVALFIGFVIFFNAPLYIEQRDWWGLFGFVWPYISLLLVLPGIRWELRQKLGLLLALPDKAPELRAKLHDEQLVPYAADQPTPLSGDELPFAPTKIGPFKRWKASMIVSLTFGILCLLLGLGGAWGIAFLLTHPETGFRPGPAFPLIDFIGLLILASFIILFCCGLAIALLIAAWRAPRGATVTADDWGLHWRRGGSGQQSRAALAWQDAQGFYLVTYQGKQAGTYKAYLLDGCDTALLWRLTPRSTAAERAATELLARLIVTRTRLPLRDLSALLAAGLFSS